MKAIFSGVQSDAAQIRSPSFSRSPSSVTMTISPRAIASIASVTEWDIAATSFVALGSRKPAGVMAPPVSRKMRRAGSPDTHAAS